MPNSPGPLLNHLPAIYHTSEDLRTVLSVFEAVLFGTDGEGPSGQRRWQFGDESGLDEQLCGEEFEGEERRQQSIDESRPLGNTIANIASLFDALKTPKEFVPWLAQWVALTHLDGLTEERQRQLLAEIVPLYAKRGTKKYLEQLLAFFTPENARVEIMDQGLQGFVVGTAKLGLDSRLERDRPFWFQVTISVPASRDEPEKRKEFRAQWEQGVRQVIDLAKPAHTLYELHWQFE